MEERSWGGTCLNRGCVPTKTLLHASEVYRSAADGAAIGIHAEGLRADIPEIFAYKERISRQLCGGVESLLKGAGVTLLRGQAVITAPGSVRVTGEDGGDYETRRILIATGSVPVRPPIPGLELAMTSDELLEGTDHLYRSIVIIGEGVIGVEFATFYSDLGCSVTLLEGMDRLLPNMDRELGQNLALILKKQGVQVCTRSMVDRLEQTPEGIAVHYTAKETPGCAVGEAVLCAIGRRAFRDGLFAEGLVPETNGHGLWVDEHYQTSIPGVYAIGDVSSPVQLAHVAAAQGAACVEHMAGLSAGVCMDAVPRCIYCRPEIAAVGLTEAEAKERGIPVKTGKCVMGGNARTVIADPGRCFMKVTAHAETGAILGAQLMCPNASDIIGQLGQAIANGMTPKSRAWPPCDPTPPMRGPQRRRWRIWRASCRAEFTENPWRERNSIAVSPFSLTKGRGLRIIEVEICHNAAKGAAEMGIVVLGAVFVDVKGYPLSTYIPGGRNVGRVEQVPGGVSRNVVEDIANVELRPTFVSLVDDTGMGEDVVRQLRNHKVNTDYILRTPDGMGAWLAVFDNHGDVCASISKRPDLRPLAALLDEKGDEIFLDADSIALEIDMDKELVKRVFAYARKHGKAVYAVVSNMSIAVERRDFLTDQVASCGNLREAGILFSDDYSEKDLGGDGGAPAAEGPQRPHPRMIVTMGEQGAVYAEMDGESGICPATRVEVQDTTGAGDAFFAGATIGLTYGKTLGQSCAIGSRLAASVICTSSNVCPRFLPEEFGLDVAVTE